MPGATKNKTSKNKSTKNNTKKSNPKNSTKKSSNKNSSKKSNRNSTKNNRKNMLTNIKRQLNEIHGVYAESETELKTVDKSLDIEDNDTSELSEESNEELDRADNRRKLRLRWQRPGRDTIVNELEFLPDLHKYSIETRLSQYHQAYALLPDALKMELDAASEQLKKYGYSLQIGEEKWYLNHTSIFDAWTTDI
jgi:hypothetical protein